MKAITPSLPSPAPARSERGVDSAVADEAFGALIAAALGVAPTPTPQYRPQQQSADSTRQSVASVASAAHASAERRANHADADEPASSDSAASNAGGVSAAANATTGATTSDTRAGAASASGPNAETPTPSTGAPGSAPNTADGAAAKSPAAAGAISASALDTAAAALAKALAASGIDASGTASGGVGAKGAGTGSAHGSASSMLGAPPNAAVLDGPPNAAMLVTAPSLTAPTLPTGHDVLPAQLASLTGAASPVAAVDGNAKKTGTSKTAPVTPVPTLAAGAAASTTLPPATTSPTAPAAGTATTQATTPDVGLAAAAGATALTVPAEAGKNKESSSSKHDGTDDGTASTASAARDAPPGAVSFDAAMQTATPVVPVTTVPSAASMAPAFVAGGVPDQIVQIVAPLRTAKDGDYTLSLQLHPAELGPVTVHVEVHQGVLSVHLVADQGQGHDALQASLTDLRTQLQAGGVRTGDINLGAPGSLSQQGNSGAHQQGRQQAQSGQAGYDGSDRRPAGSDGGSRFGGRGDDRNAPKPRQPIGVSADSALDVRI